tara:strand:+ start:1021 stop:1263 length:243 start_codon:yes stop_codon:yes gene_type:complete
MTKKETLLYLSSQIKERRNEVTEDMARGGADLAGYQHACGQVRGFDHIQMFIADIITNLDKDNKDFESSPTDSVVKIGGK